MARSDKPHATKRSYSATHPELSGDMPDSLRNAPRSREQFDQARDPLIALQIRAMQKTESQRREESAGGSEMIKLHKPFPELRPKHEKAPLRDSFNQAWMREHRAAHQALLERQREIEREEQSIIQQQYMAKSQNTEVEPKGPEQSPVR